PVVVPRYESMQYDGTNGAALVEWLCGTVVLISDDGTELLVDYCGSERRLTVGDWAIASGGGAGPQGPRFFATETTNTDYVNGWRQISS
ncbi:MAG TPA: hypothetical protein VFH70_12325, partial [Acidimicrobiales bacterium]|nr:hypothetical protein [Acidimicrobiales bacterium]